MAIKPFAPFDLIQAAVDRAAAKIGFQRAVIGLQGLVHQHRRLRYIDGLVREELHRSLETAIAASSESALAAQLIAKLEARFPKEFAEMPAEESEIDSPAEEQPLKTRRVR